MLTSYARRYAHITRGKRSRGTRMASRLPGGRKQWRDGYHLGERWKKAETESGTLIINAFRSTLADAFTGTSTSNQRWATCWEIPEVRDEHTINTTITPSVDQSVSGALSQPVHLEPPSPATRRLLGEVRLTWAWSACRMKANVRSVPHGDEARPDCRILYVTANSFYLAIGRDGRSFFCRSLPGFRCLSRAGQGMI